MGRKRLSLKTKLASALLALGDVPYTDAKQMTADQLISLYQFDHGMLHESGHPERDMYWNITPRLIKAHRDKTRQDAVVIAKGRRIRAWNFAILKTEGRPYNPWATSGDKILAGIRLAAKKRKLRSRGFDKTRRRRMDGTVVKR